MSADPDDAALKRARRAVLIAVGALAAVSLVIFSLIAYALSRFA